MILKSSLIYLQQKEVNMEVYTSYFYKIRFFTPNTIPLSTTIWDPKWYHQNQGQDFIYYDKHGVVNGLRCEWLHPDETCADLCRGPETCLTGDPYSCQFLVNYEKQIHNIDKNWAWSVFQRVCEEFKGDTIALIVHEAPTKICSERTVLQKVWNLKEFE